MRARAGDSLHGAQSANYDEKFWFILPLQIVNLIWHTGGNALHEALAQFVEAMMKMATLPHCNHKGEQHRTTLEGAHGRHVLNLAYADARAILSQYSFADGNGDPLEVQEAKFDEEVEKWKRDVPQVGEILGALREAVWSYPDGPAGKRGKLA